MPFSSTAELALLHVNHFRSDPGLLEKEISGFGELFRMLSYQDIVSRYDDSCHSCVANGKVVVSLPGSTGAWN